MSKQNPKFTTTGHARTFSDKSPYLKPQFWANPSNHFWESPIYTESAKEYFRRNLAVMLSNVHNQIKVLNSQEL